jgi:exopolysaccharide production protein ExoZ
MITASPVSQRLLSIHYLRGVAAMMVVIYHIYSHQLAAVPHPQMVSWLKQGVAIFFVISGFVMVSSTGSQAQRPAQFMWRRIARIVPLYWFATFCLAIGTGLKDPQHLVASLFFLPAVHADNGQIMDPVLDVGWTLNFEMAFYALFALLMPLPRRAMIWVMIILLAFLPYLSLFTTPWPTAGFYLSPVLLDFAAGMLIAHLGLRIPAWGLWIGFGMLAFMSGWSDWRAISVTLPAALIVASARSLDGRLREWRFATLLGDASYAIYLSHLFVLFALHPHVGKLGGGLTVLTLATVLSVAAGIVVHRCVETPLQGMRRRLGNAVHAPQSVRA